MITQVYIRRARERNRLNRRESINRTRAQEILFIRTHYECAQVAFDMCLHLFFIHFYLRFLLASHLTSYFSSFPLLFSVISSHALRVKTAWSMQHMAPWIVFYATGLLPRPLFGWGCLLCANANGALKNLPTKREAPKGFQWVRGRGVLSAALILLDCGRKRCATIKLNSASESKYIKSTSYQTFLTHLAIKLIKPKFE